MAKWWKVAILAVPLIASIYLFGAVCAWINREYNLILSPSQATIELAVWFLLSLGAVALAAGLAAALIRPLWACLLTFTLSSAALLLALGITINSGVLALIYLFAGALSMRGIARGLEDRIHFSVEPVMQGLEIWLTGLLVIVCTGFYFGYAAEIQAKGFTLPEPLVETIVAQVEVEVPAEQRAAQLAEFRAKLQQEVRTRTQPYAPFIPATVALLLFLTLHTVVGLLASLLMPLLLWIVFRLLTVLGITREITETREITRLVL
jgi:hypothetical protein